ncbi:hypothetical protein SESBI_08616 [Sesbania bispinosa]|nr:hypothetical protein SESBI_08616 [Sesbania bispinosa]
MNRAGLGSIHEPIQYKRVTLSVWFGSFCTFNLAPIATSYGDEKRRVIEGESESESPESQIQRLQFHTNTAQF